MKQMTSENTELLLEAVLEGLMRSCRPSSDLLTRLCTDYPGTRAIRLQLALLMADQAIAETFTDTTPARPEARVARATALRLATLADQAEGAGCSPVRLRDLNL